LELEFGKDNVIGLLFLIIEDQEVIADDE
jgi:hypothetical protein